MNLPNAQVIPRGGNEVGIRGPIGGKEHEVRGGIRVVEDEAVIGGEVGGGRVEMDEFDLVAVVFDEASYGEAGRLVMAN